MLICSRAYFTKLNEADRCKAIKILGQIPCASHGSLTIVHDQGGAIRDSKCSICEGSKPLNIIEETPDRIASQEAILIFSKLVKSAAFLDSRKPRVLAMIALKRFAVHFKNPEFVDLEVSSLGQWCLQSLRSSIRELRLAAG